MTGPQASETTPKVRKRIIVACDGTWQDADSDSTRDYPGWMFWRRDRHLTPVSNVARLCRCISQEGTDDKGNPIPQLVFYQAGVGTSWMQRLGGGLTGRGITSNIRDAYSFICSNYSDGDEIFLFGFSRGAFTVRSLSTLVRTIGILNSSGLAHLFSICQDWKNQNEPKWPLTGTPFIDEPWGSRTEHRPSPGQGGWGQNAYVKKLKVLDLVRSDKAPIGIKACGVWDTVGSLGVPQVWFIPQISSKRYAFVDTNVENTIEYAFQALALDERRGPFTPTIWDAPANGPKELKQCWFRGVHCDVGGGAYPDQELANLSLAWMMTQLESKQLLQFDHDVFWRLIDTSARAQTRKIPSSPMPSLRAWGLGHIHDSMQWFYRVFTFSRDREPRSFTKPRLNPSWWQQVREIFSPPKLLPLENTREFIHSSVGKRRRVDDVPCRALKKWSYDHDKAVWTKTGADPMAEDKLQGLELELSQRWDDIVHRAKNHNQVAN